MRRALLTLVPLLWPLHASAAQEWSVQYLANFGGTRDIVVPFDKRQATEAYIDNDEGVRIRIGCYALEERDTIRTTGFMAFAKTGAENGPFLGRDAGVTATFDQGTEYELGRFGYSRGAYWADLPPQVIVMLVLHETVSLRDTQSDFVADFPLAGAGSAISKVECKR